MHRFHQIPIKNDIYLQQNWFDLVWLLGFFRFHKNASSFASSPAAMLQRWPLRYDPIFNWMMRSFHHTFLGLSWMIPVMVCCDCSETVTMT
jgi:hypothetical protein